MKNRKLHSFSHWCALAALTLSTVACGSLSGIGGSSSLSCPLGPGGACQSTRTTYREAMSGNFKTNELPQSSPPTVTDYKDGTSMGAVMASIATSPSSLTQTSRNGTAPRDRTVPTSGMPLRSESQMLRIWFAPFEDDEGILRDQSYSYAVVDTGRWLIEHNQKRIQNQYSPITSPSATQTTNSGSRSASSETPPAPRTNTMPDNDITRSLGITTPNLRKAGEDDE